MYNKSEIEDRNLAITTYELNYEILKTYLINFYNEKSKEERISFAKCIENLKTSKIITEQECDEILNFSKKKIEFCRFIDKSNDNLKIEEIENYTNYLRNFLDTFLVQINIIDEPSLSEETL